MGIPVGKINVEIGTIPKDKRRNVREEPNEDSTKLIQLKEGEKFVILEPPSTGNWYKIRLHEKSQTVTGKKEGFISIGVQGDFFNVSTQKLDRVIRVKKHETSNRYKIFVVDRLDDDIYEYLIFETDDKPEIEYIIEISKPSDKYIFKFIVNFDETESIVFESESEKDKKVINIDKFVNDWRELLELTQDITVKYN